MLVYFAISLTTLKESRLPTFSHKNSDPSREFRHEHTPKKKTIHKVFLIFYWCFHFWLIKFLYSIYSQMGSNSIVSFIFSYEFYYIIIEYVSMTIKTKETNDKCCCCCYCRRMYINKTRNEKVYKFQSWCEVCVAVYIYFGFHENQTTHNENRILIKLEYNQPEMLKRAHKVR